MGYFYPHKCLLHSQHFNCSQFKFKGKLGPHCVKQFMWQDILYLFKSFILQCIEGVNAVRTGGQSQNVGGELGRVKLAGG